MKLRDHITPQEREAAWKLGATIQYGTMDKSAAVQIPDILSPAATLKGVATVALVTGIPIGTLAHIVGQKVSASRAKERRLMEEAQYYRNAGKQLEYGLAGI